MVPTIKESDKTGKQTEITNIIKSALQFQDVIAQRMPLEKRQMGEGRVAKMIVDDPTGKDHTVLYFQVVKGRLHLLEGKRDTRNEIILWGMPESGYYGTDLFIDIFKHRGMARKAYTENWLTVKGEVAAYDSEEMLQMLEDYIELIAKKVGFR